MQKYEFNRNAQLIVHIFMEHHKLVVMKPDEITPEQRLVLEEIGKRLQELRKSKNIGSAEMANIIGVSRNGYSMIEHGKTFFKFSKLMLLLQFHQISYSDFFKNL